MCNFIHKNYKRRQQQSPQPMHTPDHQIEMGYSKFENEAADNYETSTTIQKSKLPREDRVQNIRNKTYCRVPRRDRSVYDYRLCIKYTCKCSTGYNLHYSVFMCIEYTEIHRNARPPGCIQATCILYILHLFYTTYIQVQYSTVQYSKLILKYITYSIFPSRSLVPRSQQQQE